MNHNDLELDDEVTRLKAFTDSPKLVAGITLRPLSVASLSWCQDNGVFDYQGKNKIWRNAAYAYLHSADRRIIQSVVNDRDAFSNAVDDWMDANFLHHDQIAAFDSTAADAINFYMASTTTSSTPSDIGTAPAKN